MRIYILQKILTKDPNDGCKPSFGPGVLMVTVHLYNNKSNKIKTYLSRLEPLPAHSSPSTPSLSSWYVCRCSLCSLPVISYLVMKKGNKKKGTKKTHTRPLVPLHPCLCGTCFVVVFSLRSFACK
jgi:hypothetical protein